MENVTVPTYVINLKHRTDRKEFVTQQFTNRVEFDVQIIEACTHEIGSIGLWNSIKKIITLAMNGAEEYIAICEDDHQFTSDYSKEKLFASIADAKKMNADVLSGGVSWFTGTIQCTENIYWVEVFSGTQFLIIFRNFFESILNAAFTYEDAADYKICSLTERRFFICPFISVQKCFGYSDASIDNNLEGRVEKLFQYSCSGIQLLRGLADFYNNTDPLVKEEINSYDMGSIKIPTYVISLPEQTGRIKYIEEQFKGKNEFDVTIVQACYHKISAVGLWMSIRKIIETAMANDDDVIVICEDDHAFTEHYSKEKLIRNIIEAHYQQVDYISGGSDRFGMALGISANRIWTDYCYSTRFIVIFRKFFKIILAEPFDDSIIVDMKLSDLTMNKMLFCPFISRQNDPGCSDVVPMHTEFSEALTRTSNNRIDQIHDAYVKLFNGSD